jgi:hypothetical protein
MEDIRIKHMSDTVIFFQTLAGFAIAALVMFGVGGTVYKVVAPDGWMAQAFGRGLAGGMAATLALFALALFAWLTREWISPRRRNRLSELFVYAFAGTGVFYTLLIMAQGQF